MRKIIGISGKVGSGKSFISEHISRETGIRLVKLDYDAAAAASKPILKQMLQKRLKVKIPKPHKDIQLFPLMRNMEKSFSKFELALFKKYLNRRVEKIIRQSNESLIIDFVVLPMLKVSKKFDEIYLVESDEAERFKKLEIRDGMEPDTAKRADLFIKRYYAINDIFPFTDKITNDYKNVPKKAEEIIFRLTSLKNGDII